MDVETALALTTAAASAAAGGAATAAGDSAWRSLLSLTRRLTGRGGEDGTPLPVDPGDEEAVRVLLTRLAERAHADATFADELCHWATTHRAALDGDPSEVHTNIVTGDAKVTGPVIQARDIHGGIHFG